MSDGVKEALLSFPFFFQGPGSWTFSLAKELGSLDSLEVTKYYLSKLSITCRPMLCMFWPKNLYTEFPHRMLHFAKTYT